MIITGYQGIGKSTLAKNNDKIIDLESSCFWKYDLYDFEEKGEKSRPEDWYVYYCQMAQYLSKQGYIVFVSCHPEVRKFLSIRNSERFCAIFPDKSIKDEWIERLRNRYTESNSDKDLRALQHAEKYFDSDISQLWYECQYGVDYYHDAIILKNIDYDLKNVVETLLKNCHQRETARISFDNKEQEQKPTNTHEDKEELHTSWDEIESHLFERYCVEGEDKVLDSLMKEHDSEIRKQTIEDFTERLHELCGVEFNDCQYPYLLDEQRIDEVATEMLGQGQKISLS